MSTFRGRARARPVVPAGTRHRPRLPQADHALHADDRRHPEGTHLSRRNHQLVLLVEHADQRPPQVADLEVRQPPFRSLIRRPEAPDRAPFAGDQPVAVPAIDVGELPTEQGPVEFFGGGRVRGGELHPAGVADMVCGGHEHTVELGPDMTSGGVERGVDKLGAGRKATTRRWSPVGAPGGFEPQPL
ncbi:hypothetical protein QP028_06460 [Corynebacterium suedekumii]|nr:hypothetical protein QP028_06460 [Corynebacterium suedekumii]